MASQSSPTTLVGYVDRWASVSPETIALTDGDAEWSYQHLAAAVSTGARRLDAMGVRHGDHVAVVGLNSAAWVIAFLAVMHTGAVVVPVNTRVGAKQLAALLNLAAPAVVLADETARTTLGPAKRGFRPSPLELFTERTDESAAFPAVSGDAGKPALISFTSGTTGEPKGAVISHRALVASAEAFTPYLDLGPGDRTTALVPLFHNTGYVDQLAHMLTIGGSLDVLPEFHTSSAVDTLRRRPAQYLATVPSILRLLMLHPAADEVFAPCRVITFGGAPMPPAWSREMAGRWPHLRLLHGYGLTEFTSATHILPAEDLLSRGKSVGPPLPGVDCEIWDEHDTPVPAGTSGHVVVAGPMRMDGYWANPGHTAEKLRGRWLRTGDIGSMSTDGYLTIAGRATQVINRGGEKIYPNHLEDVLARLPSVAESAVVGAPHPVLQERVLAAVRPRPGSKFSDAEARALLAQEVPDYAIPEHFVVCDELPHNASGKLDRARTRDLVLSALAITRTARTAAEPDSTAGALSPSPGGDQ